LSGGGCKRDNITATKTGVEFEGREFTQGEKPRLDGREVVSGSANSNVKDCAGIGLRELAREIGFVNAPDMPIE
jgi:hypothetical protein